MTQNSKKKMGLSVIITTLFVIILTSICLVTFSKTVPHISTQEKPDINLNISPKDSCKTTFIAEVIKDTIPAFFKKSAKEGLKEALLYYDIKHSEIVYAQAVLETGNFTSKHCLQGNNLFGLYNSKQRRYFRYKHWTESVKAYKSKIQNRHKPNENYYSFLKRIRYAVDPNYINKLKTIVSKNKHTYEKRSS